MAINYPGPYEVRIYYTVTISTIALLHTQRLNVRLDGDPTPGDTFDTINVLTKADTSVPLDQIVDEWVTTIKPFWSGAGTIDYAELWKYEPESFEASFISTYAIAVAGTGAAAPVNSGQVIMTFRTLEGNIMKLSFMETGILQAIPRTYSGMTTVEKAVVDYLLGAAARFLARDTSYPFASIRSFPGQNEATFKRRYRTT